MTGSTPPWKRRFSRRGADQGPLDGPYSARDDERGPTDTGTVPLEAVADRAVAFGALLRQGIGDTIRVSLSAPPVEEVKASARRTPTRAARTSGS
ncbi:flavodoxin-dependent (E)-4-hydroxy-3-methylbut-2-enyl-diphosphate synthase, partial [Streptomyces olivaceus]